MFKYELPPFFVTDLFILESFDPESSKLCQTTVDMCTVSPIGHYGSMDVQYVY